MKSWPLLIFALCLSAAIAVLHAVALAFYLYWSFPWFDTVLHFLGGVLAAVVGLWITVRFLPFIDLRKNRDAAFVMLLSVVSIGVSWEVFEYITGLRGARNYVFDTTIDLSMDLLGAVAVYGVLVYSRIGRMIRLS